MRAGPAFALALVAAIAAGCSGSNSAHTGTGTSSTAPAAVTNVRRPAGDVTLAAPAGTFDRVQLERFTTRTGCRVDLRPLTPGSASQALDAGADVALIRSDEAGALASKGLLAPIEHQRIPALSSLAPPFRHPAATSAGGASYGVPVLWSALVLLTSPRSFPTGPPTSWRVLFQPSSGGRIAMLDDPLVIAAAANYLGADDPFSLSPDDQRSAESLLTDQRALGVRYLASPADVVEAVRRGTAVAAMGLPPAMPRSRVTATVPVEGTIGWTQDLVLSPGRHRACAYKLLGWSLTPQEQARLALASGTGPTNAHACTLSPPACRAEHTDDHRSFANVTWAQAPSDPLRPGVLLDEDWKKAWDAIAHAG
jgi:spermidine/putrescine-binding protein